MKVYLIAPGEELTPVADERIWMINVFDEENEEIDILMSNCIARLGLSHSVPIKEPTKFAELRNTVNLIWCESSDVKDFAKRLCDACIADRVFEQVKIQSEDDE